MHIKHLGNTRLESEEHFYEADHQRLLDLELEPHKMVDASKGCCETF